MGLIKPGNKQRLRHGTGCNAGGRPIPGKRRVRLHRDWLPITGMAPPRSAWHSGYQLIGPVYRDRGALVSGDPGADDIAEDRCWRRVGGTLDRGAIAGRALGTGRCRAAVYFARSAGSKRGNSPMLEGADRKEFERFLQQLKNSK